MLSDVGFINALFDIGVFFTGIILGLIFIYQGRKTNAKLLFYFGLFVLGTGLSHLGHFVDFITILITGNNMYVQLFPYLVWCLLWRHIYSSILILDCRGARALRLRSKE